MSDEFNDFISYLDENNRKVDFFVKIISIETSVVTFLTQSNNQITIPLIRVLKIKQKGKEETR